ncbi:dihydroorotate dehydrogenase (NAD+) catalytic subunit [Orbus hercynius]|uniref:Dihydroorotate dehydrogenase n=1 Tax=Orbus hercynius TaxID=593135 RepID=A0A495RCI1_9GAMM|nr:dihydroorotate dehydrogenase [Orbus hercynius]RKS85173.1 dihydroorotate dehydrogenase (NAD+) catalytic subunit [Orbus hercynius]
MNNLLAVKIGNLPLQNPIMPASGTFDTTLEPLIDFNQLGAFVTKTFTQSRRSGNALPRICEVSSGMLNAIGIPSKGVEHYISDVVPFFNRYQPPLVASISANTAAEFAQLAEILTDVKGIAAIEANISCPNIEAHGKAFAIAADSTKKVIKMLRRATPLPLWAKLTPNTGDIISVAKAVEDEGGDAIVVGNTLLGMAIDVKTRRPKLGNIMGGFSGPAIKPINLRMTYQCFKHVSIPVIGCGGIETLNDVLEYLLAGATAVQVGTANFIEPTIMTDLVQQLTDYCQANNIKSMTDLIGQVDDTPFEPYTALS